MIYIIQFSHFHKYCTPSCYKFTFLNYINMSLSKSNFNPNSNFYERMARLGELLLEFKGQYQNFGIGINKSKLNWKRNYDLHLKFLKKRLKSEPYSAENIKKWKNYYEINFNRDGSGIIDNLNQILKGENPLVNVFKDRNQYKMLRDCSWNLMNLIFKEFKSAGISKEWIPDNLPVKTKNFENLKKLKLIFRNRYHFIEKYAGKLEAHHMIPYALFVKILGNDYVNHYKWRLWIPKQIHDEFADCFDINNMRYDLSKIKKLSQKYPILRNYLPDKLLLKDKLKNVYINQTPFDNFLDKKLIQEIEKSSNNDWKVIKDRIDSIIPIKHGESYIDGASVKHIGIKSFLLAKSEKQFMRLPKHESEFSEKQISSSKKLRTELKQHYKILNQAKNYIQFYLGHKDKKPISLKFEENKSKYLITIVKGSNSKHRYYDYRGSEKNNNFYIQYFETKSKYTIEQIIEWKNGNLNKKNKPSSKLGITLRSIMNEINLCAVLLLSLDNFIENAKKDR